MALFKNYNKVPEGVKVLRIKLAIGLVVEGFYQTFLIIKLKEPGGSYWKSNIDIVKFDDKEHY